jgi:hypothetical protein
MHEIIPQQLLDYSNVKLKRIIGENIEPQPQGFQMWPRRGGLTLQMQSTRAKSTPHHREKPDNELHLQAWLGVRPPSRASASSRCHVNGDDARSIPEGRNNRGAFPRSRRRRPICRYQISRRRCMYLVSPQRRRWDAGFGKGLGSWGIDLPCRLYEGENGTNRWIFGAIFMRGRSWPRQIPPPQMLVVKLAPPLPPLSGHGASLQMM